MITPSSVKSGSVGGVYIYPQMTDELVAEAMKRSSKWRYDIEVNEDLLKNGPCVLAVYNKKRSIGFWNWTDEHPDIVAKRMAERGKDEQWLKTLRTQRHVPDWLMREAYPPSKYGKEIETANGNYFDKYFYAPKPDKYGLPWGKIEDHDKTESERLRRLYQTKTMQELIARGAKFGDTDIHYADIRFLYELVEETGYLAVRERLGDDGEKMYLPDGETPIYDSLFERFAVFYKYDRIDPNDQTIDHEIYFFWIKDAVGKLNEEGAQGETDPPEILPLKSLKSGRHGKAGNFYPTHAHGIMMLLDKLIREQGKSEYIEALKYLQWEFPPNNMLRREPHIKEPNLNLPDNEMFTEMFKDVRPLK